MFHLEPLFHGAAWLVLTKCGNSKMGRQAH
jgi:hypothetical protein